MAKITLTAGDREKLELAASRPWVNARWVEQQRTAAACRAPVSDPFLLARRAEQDAALADAEARLEAQEMFTQLACKVFGLRYYTANTRAGRCPVTGEAVEEDRGLLVKEGGRSVVYSRRGVARKILEAAGVTVEGD